MAENGHELVKWAFDGIGGAAVLALIGWVWNRVQRKKSAKHPSGQTAPKIGDDSNSIAIGAGANLSGAPILMGSHNVVNISTPLISEKKDNEDDEDDSSVSESLTVFAAVIVAGLIGGFIYFSERTEKSIGRPNPDISSPTRMVNDDKASDMNAKTPLPPSHGSVGHGPRTSVGIAIGENLPERGFGILEDNSCITNGIICLGEERLSGQTVNVPLQKGTQWARVVLLVSTFGVPDGYVDDPHVVVSSSDDKVSLEYALHRDGLLHNRLEFTPSLLQSTSESRQPDAFTVDILPGSEENMPLKVEVWGKGLPHHSVAFNLKLRSAS